MSLHIGTSGWQYRHWRERYYPKEVPQSRWLELYANDFRVVEVNSTFYRLPAAETFRQWRERSPDDFIFVTKLSRYLTHVKRLKDPSEPVRKFMDHAGHLGSKLGPLLLQLPPNLQADPQRLEQVLAEFPSTVPVAVEFRHSSWFSEEVKQVLSDHNAALCIPDRHAQALAPTWKTADWAYLRLHEGDSSPHPCYGLRPLKRWVELIADQWGRRQAVYVFFNNDGRGCAIRDAIRFAEQAREHGLEPTRVPALDRIVVD